MISNIDDRIEALGEALQQAQDSAENRETEFTFKEALDILEELKISLET